MSAETLEWLRTNTLIGYSDELGSAWHVDKGGATNHHELAVPIDAVERLFSWEAQSVEVYVNASIEEGLVPIEGRRAIQHPSTSQVFNIVSDRYAIHQYKEWLLENVSALLDESEGELGIGSAGLLRGGGQVWVQVRPAETTMIGGEEQLPWILATTSHDGTLATQYKGCRQRTVCDNTMAVALSERRSEYRVRHLSGNDMKLAEARAALELIFTAQDAFDDEVQRLMETFVSEEQFNHIIKEVMPVPEAEMEDGKVKNRRAINNARKHQLELDRLWSEDPRVEPWKLTKWGAMQAFNTWWHWGRVEGRGIAGAGSNFEAKSTQVRRAVTGETATFDRQVAGVIDRVLEVV